MEHVYRFHAENEKKQILVCYGRAAKVSQLHEQAKRTRLTILLKPEVVVYDVRNAKNPDFFSEKPFEYSIVPEREEQVLRDLVEANAIQAPAKQTSSVQKQSTPKLSQADILKRLSEM